MGFALLFTLAHLSGEFVSADILNIVYPHPPDLWTKVRVLYPEALLCVRKRRS